MHNEEPYIFAWSQIGGWSLIIILITFFGDAKADSLHLKQDSVNWAFGGFLYSKHHRTDNFVNEDHRNSFYFRVNGWTGGIYENSFSTDENEIYSRFFGHQTELGKWRGTRISAFIGVVDGYKHLATDLQLRPFATLNIKLGPAKIWQIGTVTALGWEVDQQVRDWIFNR